MSAPDQKICAIVPSHNHWMALGAVLAPLRAAGLTVFIIDDGSAEPARSALAAHHDPADGVTVHRLPVNQGKGGAVMAGMDLAEAAGFTHALQVDADGQHDLGRLDDMLSLARENPQALVTGVPVYDASIPCGRAIGRWITHVWVWIETLSLQIRDSMCGFRVYPLAAVRRLRDDGEIIGRRMDFDTEVMVRLFWRGTAIAQLPVRVTYPPGNTSNFDVWRDNLRISAMHTRLFFTMLVRLPAIVVHRPAKMESATHWARFSERGLYWGLRICAAVYQLLGYRLSRLLLAPIVLFFYLTGHEQRRASHDFMRRAFAARGEAKEPGFWSGYRHFLSFAGRAIDAVAAWSGRLPRGVMDNWHAHSLDQAMEDTRGAVIVVSHVGNVEVSRALLDPAVRRRLLVLTHTKHAANYNRVLREINPETALNTLQVTELDAATAVLLKERVDQGSWIVIAGDRVPVSGQGRVSLAPFLGQPAPFPQGPFILAALMDCPVYTLFCRREGGRYILTATRLADRVTLPRGRRMEALDGYVADFARALEEQALLDPYQWYNFFDFWAVQKDAVTP